MPGWGVVTPQLSVLPEFCDAQSCDCRVGTAPALTYKSTSPMPPEVVTARFVAPEGTCTVKLALLLVPPPRLKRSSRGTVPPPLLSLLKMAVTLAASVPAVMLQLPVPLQAPLQPAKL